MSEITIAETRAKVEAAKNEYRDEIAKFPENWRQTPLEKFRRDMNQKLTKLSSLQHQAKRLTKELQRRKAFEAAVCALNSQIKCGEAIDDLNDSYTFDPEPFDAKTK